MIPHIRQIIENPLTWMFVVLTTLTYVLMLIFMETFSLIVDIIGIETDLYSLIALTFIFVLSLIAIVFLVVRCAPLEQRNYIRSLKGRPAHIRSSERWLHQGKALSWLLKRGGIVAIVIGLLLGSMKFFTPFFLPDQLLDENSVFFNNWMYTCTSLLCGALAYVSSLYLRLVVQREVSANEHLT